MPYEEIITLWLLTHYFRGKAAEVGAAGYDLLRNYYPEYACNQYFVKILLDRSISNTMAQNFRTRWTWTADFDKKRPF